MWCWVRTLFSHHASGDSQSSRLVIIEAQASKVPVLAAPTAGIPEIIAHEKTGFLVPADDAAGYADNLYYLLDNRSLYAQIAETAYSAVVREYGWKTYIERIWGVYQALLQS